MRTILILAFFHLTLLANAYQVIVNGVVTDLFQGNYVANQEMIIELESDFGNGYYYINTVTTDQFGFYVDTVFVEDSIEGTIRISTYECGVLSAIEDWFSPTYSQITINFEICTDNFNSCEAYFTYDTDLEPLTVQFFDESVGAIGNWFWDFGDDTYSEEQNPLHVYPHEGMFHTSLTITGDSCFSVYDIWVEVYINPVDCEAFYEYEALQHPNTVSFYDTSFGLITNWYWDFGDATFSYEQDPVHEFPGPGTYYVSLYIQSVDSCTDVFADYVQVGNDTVFCNADFYYTLDTLNNTPHTYYFIDQSTGDIDSWYWEFGDGSFSFEKDPVHVYATTGNYEVTLTVSSQQGIFPCMSSITKNVSTINYYDFGGQTFLGNYPINEDTIDIINIAVAHLYRKVNNNWEYMDSREFWNYGYYWFLDKPVGEYIIMTELKEGSADYDLYAPAYHTNSLSWKDASVFTLSNEEQFAVNVSFKELAQYNTGIGRISGNISGDISCDTLNNIDFEHVLIQLFNNSGQIISYTFTDSNGFFEINGLGSGDYSVKAEYPGRYSEQVTISLTASEPNNDNIEIVVYCSHILGISETISNEPIKIESLHPNPVSGSLKLKYLSEVYTTGEINIFNINGGIVYADKISVNNGVTEKVIDVSTLPIGMYFLKSTFNDHYFQRTLKIIVIH